MKNAVKVIGALVVISVLFMASCTKDTSPADRDLFVGTYKGTISYNDGEKDIADDDGRVTVTKVGESYSFLFGTGIPDLTNVKFQKSTDDTYVSVGDGLTGITISASALKILVINDGRTWTANCTR